MYNIPPKVMRLHCWHFQNIKIKEFDIIYRALKPKKEANFSNYSNKRKKYRKKAFGVSI